MKIGIRTPSIDKKVKARTTGRVKRAAKGTINPFYGRAGMGYIKDPERAIKNKIYHKVTVDPLDLVKDAVSDPGERKSDPVQIEQPERQGSTIFTLLCFTYIISFIYTLVKLALYRQLPVVAVIIFIVSFTAVVILRRKYAKTK